MLAANFFRLGFEEANVFGNWSRERMMAGVPPVLFLVEAEQREINDPEKVEAIGWDRQFALSFKELGAIKPDLAQDFAGSEPLVGGKQDQVTFLDQKFFLQSLFLG